MKVKHGKVYASLGDTPNGMSDLFSKTNNKRITKDFVNLYICILSEQCFCVL